MQVTFRGATATDWEAIVPLMLCLYQDDPSPHPVTLENNISLTLQETIQHPEKLQLIAFQLKEEIIGYSLLACYWSNELGGDVIFVDELFIQASDRGKGIATQFFTWLEQTFGDRAKAFVLETTPTNERARSLYQKLGFAPYKNQLLIKLVSQLKPVNKINGNEATSFPQSD